MPSDRQRPAHCAELSIETQFSDEHAVSERARLELSRCDEDPQRDREIEGSALLSNIGRCKVHGNPPRRNIEARVEKRCSYALAALPDGTGGESDNRPLRKPRRGVDLNDHVVCVDSYERR